MVRRDDNRQPPPMDGVARDDMYEQRWDRARSILIASAQY
jgi:hypothetical protein